MTLARQRAAAVLREHEQRIDRSIAHLRAVGDAYAPAPRQPRGFAFTVARALAAVAFFLPHLWKLVRH